MEATTFLILNVIGQQIQKQFTTEAQRAQRSFMLAAPAAASNHNKAFLCVLCALYDQIISNTPSFYLD